MHLRQGGITIKQETNTETEIETHKLDTDKRENKHGHMTYWGNKTNYRDRAQRDHTDTRTQLGRQKVNKYGDKTDFHRR